MPLSGLLPWSGHSPVGKALLPVQRLNLSLRCPAKTKSQLRKTGQIRTKTGMPKDLSIEMKGVVKMETERLSGSRTLLLVREAGGRGARGWCIGIGFALTLASPEGFRDFSRENRYGSQRFSLRRRDCVVRDGIFSHRLILRAQAHATSIPLSHRGAFQRFGIVERSIRSARRDPKLFRARDVARPICAGAGSHSHPNQVPVRE
jgi:hypothetical protein